MAAPLQLSGAPALAVGSGWGRHAAETFAADPRVTLVGLVGRGSERTRRLAGRLGVPWFDDLARAVAETAPRVAAVAVGERTNAALARCLLAAGCHVLCSHPVAPDPESVGALRALAAERGLLAATDYTLRLTRPLQVARGALASAGPLLRLSVASPGRTIVMGVDLALALAGPVGRVFAASRYPPALDHRRRRSPATFPPTFVLEHAGGCVTSVTPVPHADPRAAFRARASAEGARVDLDLPAGAVARVRALGGGRAERTLLLAEEPPRPAAAIYAGAMARLVTRFLDAVEAAGAPVAPLAHEEQVRALWRALRRSARERQPVEVEPGAPSPC